MRIVFLTFGNETFSRARQRIRFEALNCGWFTDVLSLSEYDLPESIKQFCDANIHVDRGYGCYIWKPVVVSMVANKFADGEAIVFYVDAGFWLNRFGARYFRHYLSKISEETPFLIFERLDNKEQQSTKKAVFEELGVEELKDTHPIMAGAFGVLINQLSRKVIDEWRNICLAKPYLIDQSPTPSGQEFPEYEANRNEQGVFSLLLKKYQCFNSFSAEHILPEVNTSFEAMSQYPFIAARSKT